MTSGRIPRGFTLVEAIMAMTITGIVAGMIAVFIARPVQGYVDSVRRAGLTDVADLALKRIGLDLRGAVPNSVRVTSSGTDSFLEFIPARSGGRYCVDTDTPACTNKMIFGSSTTFDVLGTVHDAAAGEFVVIYNTGQAGLNAYDGDTVRLISAGAATSTTRISYSGAAFTYASPSNRFQVIPSTGPASFACETIGGTSTGTGTLRRYSGYNTGVAFVASQPTSFASATVNGLLADNLSACSITYNAVSARNGVISIRLTITRESESVTLLHQIHVDNMP